MGTDSFVQQNVSGTLAGGTSSELGTVTGIASSRDNAGHKVSRAGLSSLVFLSNALGKQPNWGEEAPFGICKTRGGFGPE